MRVHERVVWYLVLYGAGYAMLAGGLLAGPRVWWTSPSYYALLYLVPLEVWGALYALAAGACLATLTSHQRRGPHTLWLLRATTIAGAAISGMWWLSFISALFLGHLVAFSAVVSWLIVVGFHVEMARYGGRHE